MVKECRIDDQTYYGSVAGHYRKVIKQTNETHQEEYFSDITEAIKALMIKRHIIEK